MLYTDVEVYEKIQDLQERLLFLDAQMANAWNPQPLPALAHMQGATLPGPLPKWQDDPSE